MLRFVIVVGFMVYFGLLMFLLCCVLGCSDLGLGFGLQGLRLVSWADYFVGGY